MTHVNTLKNLARGLGFAGSLLVGAMMTAPTAEAAVREVCLDVNVRAVDQNGTDVPYNGPFRWLVEEANNHPVTPGVSTHHLNPWDAGDPDTTDAAWKPGRQNNTGLDLHFAHAPVLASGTADAGAMTRESHPNYAPATTCAAGALFPLSDDTVQRMFVSVLPGDANTTADATMSGTEVAIDPATNSATATVIVNVLPIPTAQIRVFVFEDNWPTNNAPDQPEQGLAGFSLFMEDAGGRYGASGGQFMYDAFGNLLGTRYPEQTTHAECVAAEAAAPTTVDWGGNDPLDPASTCTILGNGTLITDANGEVIIKNLAPGKYGVKVIPPKYWDDPSTAAVENVPLSEWSQVSTIEGTPLIDAWVKAGEPSYWAEFGLPGPHVFVGFVRRHNELDPAGGVTISGEVRTVHTSRAPDMNFAVGPLWTDYNPASNCWIALNDAAGRGQGLYADECGPDSSFSIAGVPDGPYQLAIWDRFLDAVIGFYNVNIANGQCVDTQGNPLNGTGSCDLGPVTVFPWFTRMDNYVFWDGNENGFPDSGETILLEVPTLLRWRDGSIYQEMPTDAAGYAPLDQIFPFFNWLVAEVDFARFKATGATMVVDAGGTIGDNTGVLGAGNEWWDGQLTSLLMNPQPQFETTYDPGTQTWTKTPLINPNTGNNLSRTEIGPVLTQATQGFLGQTSAIYWGKKNYNPNDPDGATNGGISGMAIYATTRAEDDPEQAAVEPWEPGIPRVQITLYADSAPHDHAIDDMNGDGLPTPAAALPTGVEVDNTPGRADVDNHPLGFAFGGAPGPEDFDRNGNGVFDVNDAIAITWTDSFDDDPPTGCQGDIGSQSPFFVKGDAAQGVATDCYDGMRAFNQVRDGVFDGGFAFETYAAGGLVNAPGGDWQTAQDNGPWLPAGQYIIGAGTPEGYKLLRSQSRNVDLGEEYTPNPALLPNGCIGDPYTVPANLDIFPEPAPLAGQQMFDCDLKTIDIVEHIYGLGSNSATEFMFYTDVPRAARIVGMILDDLANEFDPTNPAFGEKYAPQWLPVSIRDFKGREIVRTYSDEFGRYGTLVPSTYTMNLPMQSGASPNMLTACMNDAGPIPDGNGGFIVDPNFQRQYSQFCYVFQYMPGSTTYLDTPVVPTAAFAADEGNTLDCECDNGTPVIAQAYNSVSNNGPVAASGQNLTIVSAGLTAVPNPAFTAAGTEPRLIDRDYGFGAVGAGSKVELVDAAGVAAPMAVVAWADAAIEATVPAGLDGEYQLVVTKDDGTASKTGLTVHVPGATYTPVVMEVNPAKAAANPGSAFGTIQAAIDAAIVNADNPPVITVAPGRYSEMVIANKPVKLQGWGAHSTGITAINVPGEKLLEARTKAHCMMGLNGCVATNDSYPGQALLAGGLEPNLFPTEEGAGVLVLGVQCGVAAPKQSCGTQTQFHENTLIDGLTLQGSDHAGGVVLNGWTGGVKVSNNRIQNNHGVYGGGVRAGQPFLPEVITRDFAVENEGIEVSNNMVVMNAANFEGAGGITMYRGSHNYRVTDNFVCGNFSLGNGAGISHLGYSDGGVIANNTVVYNHTFNQGITVDTGGVHVAGQLTEFGLSAGTGNVTVDSNLIQGNYAGSGSGGGLSIVHANGMELLVPIPDEDLFEPNQLTAESTWDTVVVQNNILANNVTALKGTIYIEDSLKVSLVNNTLANNDATATAFPAFVEGTPNQSSAQPVGIAAQMFGGALASRLDTVAAYSGPEWDFANPELVNNIVVGGRAHYWKVSTGAADPDCPNTAPPGTPDWRVSCLVETGVADEFSVVGASLPGHCLTAEYSVVTSVSEPGLCPSTTNFQAAAADLFVSQYQNVNSGVVRPGEPGNGIQTTPAFDEGGNFIDIRFGPQSIYDFAGRGPAVGDYHLAATAVAAIDTADDGTATGAAVPADDIDGDARPAGTGVDVGADESGHAAGPGNTAPTANDATLAVSINQALVVDLLTLAQDLEADPLDADIAVLTAGAGTLSQVGNVITYNAPATAETATITFTVTEQGGGLTSNVGTITVNVLTNQAPVLTPDFGVAVNSYLAIFPVLLNDTDPDGDLLRLGNSMSSACGSTVDRRLRTSVYTGVGYRGTMTPNTANAGCTATATGYTDTVSYIVGDGNGHPTPGTLTVDVTVDPLIIENLTISLADFRPATPNRKTKWKVKGRGSDGHFVRAFLVSPDGPAFDQEITVNPVPILEGANGKAKYVVKVKNSPVTATAGHVVKVVSTTGAMTYRQVQIVDTQ